MMENNGFFSYTMIHRIDLSLQLLGLVGKSSKMIYRWVKRKLSKYISENYFTNFHPAHNSDFLGSLSTSVLRIPGIWAADCPVVKILFFQIILQWFTIIHLIYCKFCSITICENFNVSAIFDHKNAEIYKNSLYN